MLLGSHLDTVPNGGRYDGAPGPRSAGRRAPAEGGGRGAEPAGLGRLLQRRGGARFQTGMLGSRAFCGDCDLPDWERRVPEAMADADFDFARLENARGPGRSAPTSSSTSSRARARARRRSTSASSRPSPACSVSERAFSARPTMPGRRWSSAETRSPARRGRCSPSETKRAARRHDRQRGRDLGGARRLQRRPGRRGAHDRRPLAHGRGLRPAGAVRPRGARADRGRRGARAGAPRDAPKQPSRSIPSCRTGWRKRRGRSARRRSASRAAPGTTRWCSPHVPAAMLFVPSRGGLSHTPDEFSSPEHCEAPGARAGATVRRLLSA